MKVKVQVLTNNKQATQNRYTAYASAFEKLTKDNNKQKEGNEHVIL